MFLQLSSKDIKQTEQLFWQMKLIISLLWAWSLKKRQQSAFPFPTPPASANRHSLWLSFIKKRLKHQFSPCCFSEESCFFLGRVMQNWARRFSIPLPVLRFSAHELWMSVTLFQHLISSITCAPLFHRVGPNTKLGFCEHTEIYTNIQTVRPNTNIRYHHNSPLN